MLYSISDNFLQKCANYIYKKKFVKIIYLGVIINVSDVQNVHVHRDDDGLACDVGRSVEEVDFCD